MTLKKTTLLKEDQVKAVAQLIREVLPVLDDKDEQEALLKRIERARELVGGTDVL